MKISNINNKYNKDINFTAKPPIIKDTNWNAEDIKLFIKDMDAVKDRNVGDPSLFHKACAKFLNGISSWVEHRVIQPSKKDPTKGKYAIDDLVNAGNVFKELVCMFVYPTQVLTNPDLPKDKRRFVGAYDFFVTCFSFAGTVWYMTRGKNYALKFANHAMEKYKVNPKHYPNVERAITGGAFVSGIAVQTILFKRVLAPALSPPLAAKARKWFEARDAKKAAAQGKTVEENKSEDKKDESTMIPAQYDAALSKTNDKNAWVNPNMKNTNLLNMNQSVSA